MNIYEKLANVQSALEVPKGQYNSFGKYHYRSCEDILARAKPLCVENGLALTVSDDVVEIGGRVYVKATAAVHSVGGDGEIVNTAYAREEPEKKGMDASQITGTASSYARKYALNGLFCLDDTKDADTDEHAKTTGKSECTKSTKETEQTVNCADCKRPILSSPGKSGKMIPASVLIPHTIKVYGRALCEACRNKENEKKGWDTEHAEQR